MSTKNGKSSTEKHPTRGFAGMDQEKQREIARKGGANVPNDKRSFAQNRELARRAGRKGGKSVPAAKRSFATNPALASEAGRKGGQKSGDKQWQARSIKNDRKE